MSTYAEIHGDGLTGLLADNTVNGCELGKHYRLPMHPDFYFVVRNSIDPTENQRVCLYRENVINVHCFGNDTPATMWMSNEQLYRRSLSDLMNDMAEKANEFLTRKTTGRV